MIKVNIVALVVLHIARGKQLIAREIVKRGKDIPHSQNCTKQCDEVFFILLPDNRLTQREFAVNIFIADDFTLNGKSTHLNAPVKSSKIITGFSFEAG